MSAVATSKEPVTVLGKDAALAAPIQYSHTLSRKKTFCRKATVMY